MVTVLVKKPNSAMSVMLRTEAILPISEKLLTSYFMPVSSFISFCSSRYDYFLYFRAIPSWRYSTWLQHLSIQYHLSQWSLVYLLLKYDGVLEWKYRDFSEPFCEGCWGFRVEIQGFFRALLRRILSLGQLQIASCKAWV